MLSRRYFWIRQCGHRVFQAIYSCVQSVSIFYGVYPIFHKYFKQSFISNFGPFYEDISKIQVIQSIGTLEVEFLIAIGLWF